MRKARPMVKLLSKLFTLHNTQFFCAVRDNHWYYGFYFQIKWFQLLSCLQPVWSSHVSYSNIVVATVCYQVPTSQPLLWGVQCYHNQSKSKYIHKASLLSVIFKDQGNPQNIQQVILHLSSMKLTLCGTFLNFIKKM